MRAGGAARTAGLLEGKVGGGLHVQASGPQREDVPVGLHPKPLGEGPGAKVRTVAQDGEEIPDRSSAEPHAEVYPAA